jgi:hypothetical protein
MISRSITLSVALLAGGAIPLAAFGQAHQELHAMVRHLEPVRVAGFRWVGPGRIALTTPWMDYRHGVTDAETTPYFDCAEFQVTSTDANPVGFCLGGCAATNCPTGTETPDIRWWGGPDYVGPTVVNDMTVGAGANNAQATRLVTAMNWGALTPTELILVASTAETFNDTNTPPPASGGYDGVVSDFGPQTGGPTGGYFVLDIDTSATPGLFFQMPADGSGAYIMTAANSVAGGVITPETSPSTQFMYWGTGDGETPPDGRVGHQGPHEWDDDAPPDNQFTSAEFYDETAPTICPNPVGPMAAFYGPAVTGASCYANCDSSTATPFLNVQDFTCFLTKYAAADAYANCDNSTQAPTLNVQDFSCFLTKFAAGCSAP